jgi:hypothetical protein
MVLEAGAVSAAAGALAAGVSSPFWGPDPEQAAIRLVNNARQTMPERVLRRLCWRIRTIPRAPL